MLPTEDQEAFEALRLELHEDHAPVGKTEELLVDEIAQSWWRLQRARLHETGALRNTATIDIHFFGRYMGPILRYIASAERAWHRAITQLRTAQNDRRKREASEEVPAGEPQPAEPEKVMTVGSASPPEPLSQSAPAISNSPIIASKSQAATHVSPHSPGTATKQAL